MKRILQHQWNRIKTTQAIPEIIAFGTGAWIGYCETKGIVGNPGSLESTALFLTPNVVHLYAANTGLSQGLSDPTIADKYQSYMCKQAAGSLVLSMSELTIGYSIGKTIGNLF
jgi:hypothetical protein